MFLATDLVKRETSGKWAIIYCFFLAATYAQLHQSHL